MEKKSNFAEVNFWRFFWSTVLSIVGMDLYLFTHGWYLIQLGGGGLSIGVSWAIFFSPSILMLPACSRLLKEYSVRRVQLSFEIAKASMLWVALVWIVFWPSIAAIYLLSACFGLLFSPFYPATYTLLKNLFDDGRVVKYSNLFEVSLQLAGATALFASGFIYEQLKFPGIVLVSALAVSASCLFIGRLEQVGANFPSTESWLRTYINFFRLPNFSQFADPRFLAGLTHQIPQSTILLMNVPLVAFVYQKMGAGPREYGYLDSLYGVVALATSLAWTKWPKWSRSAPVLLAASAAGCLGFIAFGTLNMTGSLPYWYMAAIAVALTTSKLMARATYIERCEKQFVAENTPLFQMFSNLTLVAGATLAGAVMEHSSVDTTMLSLAGVMAAFALGFPIIQGRLKGRSGVL